MKIGSGILLFTLGVVAGAAASFNYWYKREKKRADADIASVIESFSNLGDKKRDKKEIENDIEVIESKDTAKKIIQNNGYKDYTQYSEKTNDGKEVYAMPENNVTIISPEKYSELIGYELEALTYYSDGVLAYENDERVDTEDINTMLVPDFASHFGDYADDPDTVYICNDSMGTVFEITKDLSSYSDILGE